VTRLPLSLSLSLSLSLYFSAQDVTRLPVSLALCLWVDTRLMEGPTRPCAACGKEGATRRCPCHGESYCGPECQKALWGDHRKECTVDLTKQLAKLCLQCGSDASEVARVHFTLGMTWETRGNFEKAAQCYQEAGLIYALVEEPENCAAALYNLGGIHRILGEHVCALRELEQALIIRRRVDGNHVEVADCLNSIGIVLESQGKYEEAAEKYEQALAIFIDAFGRDHQRVTMMHFNMSNLYEKTGTTQKALESLVLVLHNQRNQLGSDHEDVANTLMTVANILRVQGQLHQALRHLHEALPILHRVHGEKSPRAASALSLVGDIYKMQGNLDAALKVQRKALRYFHRSLGPDHPRTTSARLFVAEVHISREDFQAALDQAVLAREGILRSHPDNHDNHEHLAHACKIMSCCREKLMDLAGALQSATEVHRIYSELGAAHDEDATFAAVAVQRLQTLYDTSS
jgi:tetratricopeptide (TPR) repeat protein